MNLLVFTDLHGNHSFIRKLVPFCDWADLVLATGDITHFGKSPDMQSLLEPLLITGKQVFAVAGNCDYPQAEEWLTTAGISLNGRLLEYNGFALAGLAGSLPCPGKTPNEYSEEEYSSVLGHMKVPSGIPMLLVSHQPPFGVINDSIAEGVHVGSHAVKNFIAAHQPLACFTGHIHEGKGVGFIGNCRVVNPGPARHGHYARIVVEPLGVRSVELLHFAL